MLNLKRKHVWCGLVAALLTVLIFAVTVAVPLYLSSTGIKNKIQAAVQEKLGGKVSYDKIDISLFPRPQATITGLKVAYPRTFKGTLRSISVAPQIFPLFRGRVEISKIRIQEPDFRIIMPSLKTDTSSDAPSVEETKEDIRVLLGYLELVGHRLVVEMDNGKFLLRKNHKDFLSLRNVTVHFNAPPGDMHFLVKAGTDQWGDFTLGGVYSFTDAQTEIKDLTLSLGHSSVAGYSALLTWDRDPRIEIRSGRAELALHEIYQWLKSVDSLTPFMKELSSLKGTLVITSMKGQGLISQPDKLHLRLTGEARGIELASSRLPAPVTVNSSFAVEDNLVEIADFSARMGSSSLSHVSARVTGRDDPLLDLKSGNARINITEVFGWRTWHPALAHMLQAVDALEGTFSLSELRISGRLSRPLGWRVNAAGEFDHIVYQDKLLPGPIGLLRGTFRYVPDKLAFSLKEATILDSTVTGTALVSNITTTVNTIDATIEGSSGKKTVDWAFQNLKLPPELKVKTPVALSRAHLIWERNKGTSFSGTATVAGGLAFDLDLAQQGADLEIRKFAIHDDETRAALNLDWQKQAADLTFSGVLAQSTLGRLFEQGTFGSGTLKGELHSVVRVDQPLKSRMQGSLAGSNLLIPYAPVPTTVNTFVLQAQDDVLTVESADVTWGKNHYSLNGALTTSDQGLDFSMKLDADGIDIDTIQQALSRSGGTKAAAADQAFPADNQKPEEKPEQKPRTFPLPPIRGDFSASSAYVKYGRFILAPAHAIMSVEPGTVRMDFDRTKSCGVNLAGTVLVSGASTSFTFTPSAKAAPLEQTIDCLTGRELHITGDYDLTAKIQSQGTGTGTDMLSALEGRVDFKARNGKIYQFPTLANVLSVLSVFEIFRGSAPEIGGNGFPYRAMALRGDIHKGVFKIEKCYIGGKSLDVIAEGKVDFGKHQIDMVVLVAPFSSINWLIRHTPVVNTIMGGTLITIPTRVSGDLTNPKVTVLSPTAVGSRLLSVFSNMLKAPVELFSGDNK